MNWEKIWKMFNEWLQSNNDFPCEEERRKKIEQLVNFEVHFLLVKELTALANADLEAFTQFCNVIEPKGGG